MALIFMDGFDAEDTEVKWIQTIYDEDFSHVTTTRFGSGSAFKIRGVKTQFNCFALRSFAPSPILYAGAAIKVEWGEFNSFKPTPNLFGLLSDSGATGHLYLRRMTTDAVALYRGDPRAGAYYSPSGTEIATSAAGILDSGWHYIEMTATIDDAAGHVVVKLDGVIIIDFTGDTRNGGTSTNIDAICFKAGCYLSDATDSVSVDDVYVSDSGFLGDVRVITTVPTAAGSATDLTPTGGANYANVADIPDSTATYNSSVTAGHKDLYTMGDIPASVSNIHAVQANNHAWKTDAGTKSLKNAIKSGTTTAYGATVSLPTSVAYHGDIFETDPDTSAAWTVSGVNGVEAGAEVA